MLVMLVMMPALRDLAKTLHSRKAERDWRDVRSCERHIDGIGLLELIMELVRRSDVGMLTGRICC